MKMKNYLYKTLIAFVLLAQNLLSFAYDFEVDGIYYNITSTEKSEVEVTHGEVYSSGDVVIPEYVTFNQTTYKVTGIGDRAFDGGHVHSLTIPATVVTLSRSFVNPFPNNLNILMAFYVDDNNPMYKTVDGVLFSKDLSELIRFPYKKSGDYNIPNQVKIIKQYAFDDCGGVTIVNAESVEEIENHSFSWTYNLKTVVFSQSLKEIGDSAFIYSDDFESVSLPNNLLSIGKSAFSRCKKLKTVESKIVDPFEIAGNVFAGISSEATLIVPKGTINLYNALDCWVHHFKYVKEEGATEQTYTLSIKSTGNGSVSYSGSTIKNETSTFTINEGSSATITLSPDSGNKIKSVKVNDTDVTSSVSSNEYTISSITDDTDVEVEFEPITYTLSIKATGNGSASYSGNSVRNKTNTFTVNEGSSATISFSPDDGYQIKNLTVNGSDVTSSVSDNQYTVSNITSDMAVEVEFESIIPATYTLSINVSGNGSVSYDGNEIRNSTNSFTVNEGTSVTISFSADSGYRIKSVRVSDTDVTSTIYNSQYTISSISSDTSVEVEFEEITYKLTISAKGNGSASYDGNTIKEQTSSFTLKEGASATISFTPEDGHKIKSIKVNDADVTSSVSDNQYTIGSITSDTSVEVRFEAIIHTLSIKSTGDGSVSYNGKTIRNSTDSYTLNEGTAVSISLNPDKGYRIKTVTENGTDVTSYVSDGKYTIESINRDTNIEVEFGEITSTTYTLSIKATGNGSASYDGNTIRNTTSTFTLDEGTSATISFSPDDGYRIKIVKVNDTDVTSSVLSNQYTISSISADTNVEVEFEAIPATTYSLFIMATGNGTVTYDGNIIRNTTSTFTVSEGASVKIAFSPDSGYRIKGVKVNSTEVTSSVSGNQYTISNIASDTSVEVEFEAIPVNTYTLNIIVAGNGNATYNDTDIRNGSKTFTVNEGSTVTVVFSPDNGNRLNMVKMNGTDVTSQVSGNSYTINNIAANTDLEVTFKEDVNALTVDGVNYSVVSQSDKTVNVVGGNYGKVLTVPATVTSNGTTWKVVGVEADALNGNTELAAIIWNPEVAFTAAVSNPNLLLYVKAEEYAPAAIQNVVVNGTASKIVLKEAGSGNGFYCPQAFTAQQISYTHNYQMQTGIGESKGWETIALPFDVQTITHETKGTIVPFTQWNNESDKKPFWLMELTGTGFVETNEIKAYTPYIISMPNHPQYDSRWLLNGRVTFAASGVTVGKTENLNQPTFSDRTFVPCFADMGSDMGIYALNVNNDFETNNSGMTEGSKFVLNMRRVHPFEAYMTSSSSAPCYAIGVFEGMTTGIQQMTDGRWSKEDVVYDLQGRRVERPSKKGMYMINGKKMIIK